MKKIRVLIVDDSVFMRRALTQMLSSAPDIEVIDQAKNGREGVEKVLALEPDIVTMDVEMPIMNGLEALREIMSKHPVPVIMVSSTTTEGAQQTIEALSAGAIDFIAKRAAFVSSEMYSIQEELISKIREVAGNRLIKSRLLRRRTSAQAPPPPVTTADKLSATLGERLARPQAVSGIMPRQSRKRLPAQHFQIATLGVSTGGPLALHQVIPKLPAHLPVCLLIVQHMPPHFTKSLAERLNGISKVTVKEAQHDDPIVPGTVYIAPGGSQMLIGKNGRIIISTEDYKVLYKPSVDILVNSVIDHYGNRVLGVIMTGMGRDGSEAYRRLHKDGGYVLAQNEESCVVFGMPKAVIEDGSADEVHALDELAEAIAGCLGTHAIDNSMDS